MFIGKASHKGAKPGGKFDRGDDGFGTKRIPQEGFQRVFEYLTQTPVSQ